MLKVRGVLLAIAILVSPARAFGALPDSSLAHDAIPPPRVVRSAEWETLSTGLPEEARFRRIVRLRYNRVDGPAATLGAAFQTGRGAAPILFAEGTYAYSRDRGLYEAGYTVPFGDRPVVTVGGSAYRRTATEDDWIVPEGENTIFALTARTDDRDYYESEGGQGFITWAPGSDFELRVGGRVEEERSLGTRTRVSLTGRHPVFRPNPSIQEGEEQAFTLHARIGPRDLPVRGGTSGEALYERAGDPLHGDFEYGRLRGTVRHRVRLSPGMDFRARLAAGSTLTGSLPAQKLWYAGGIGTLRGHDYKSFRGDQFFVMNAELYRRARKNLWAFTFLDAGTAWFGRDNLSRQRPALDAGLGLRIADGPAAITVGKNLRDSDSKPLVGVRLGGVF
jgi:outer membrane protein assembly factor BamA